LISPATAHDDGPDTRSEIVLPGDDREHLLEDMRDFLERTTGLLTAISNNDMARVSRLANEMRPPMSRARALADGTPMPPNRGIGRGAQRPMSEWEQGRFARMQKNLPAPFRGMMFELRQSIDKLGRDAAEQKDRDLALRQLAAAQEICVSCHQLYRLGPETPHGGLDAK
jgi:hypothetical protein